MLDVNFISITNEKMNTGSTVGDVILFILICFFLIACTIRFYIRIYSKGIKWLLKGYKAEKEEKKKERNNNETIH